MSTTQHEDIGPLYRRLEEASTVSTLRPMLQDIAELERASEGEAEIDSLREQVFEALLRLTRDRPDEARSVLVDDLLPLCLRSKDEWPRLSMRGRYDEMLRTWLDAFPGSTRDNLRAVVLSKILEALQGQRVKSACATLYALGHRTREVVNALAGIASAHDDETGDLAVRTRIHLGVPGTERGPIVADVHRRAQKRWNHSLVACLRELADHGSLDIVFARLAVEEPPPDEDPAPFLDESAAQIPSAIAEANADDGALQDAVWQRLVSGGMAKGVRSSLIMNGELAGRIDSPEVVATYLGLLETESAVRSDIVYYRLADLVRPRQLDGWVGDPGDQAFSVLKRDAVAGTQMEAAWVTQELRRKLLAWETLLSLGRTDLSPLMHFAVDAETNGYVIGELFEIASCMALDSLPPCVPQLIAGVFTRVADTDDQRLIAHIGAISVAGSARSEEAFTALMSFATFKQEGVLLSLIDALANCAAALIDSGRSTAEEALLKTARTGELAHRRTASAAALAKLIRRNVIRRPNLRDLTDLIQDQSLDIYARRELIDACGHMRQAGREAELFAALRTIAVKGVTVDGKDTEPGTLPSLSPVALGALARWGVLANDSALLNDALGLVRSPEGWALSTEVKRVSVASFVIGIMYAESAEAFAPAVALLIRESDWLSLSRLVPHLVRDGCVTPSVVIDALVERIRRVQTGRTAEPELFSLLARLAPDRLVEEHWGDFSAWMPQARSEFADALALTQRATVTPQQLMLPLLGDGQYGVRRAAYRAMSSVDAGALATICESWALTNEGEDAVELRERAAEAAAWLPEELRSPQIAALSTDPEPTVRQAYKRCDRERRERKWAEIYVNRIMAVADDRGIEAIWRYGRALAAVGDDQILERLERHRKNGDLPPALQHWLTRIIKKLRKCWDEVTRRWPEPWFARRGRLEEVEGVVVHADGAEIAFRGWLWLVIKSDPTAISSWGGWAMQGGLRTGSATLRINGRTPAEILVNQVNAPNGATYFSGNEPYPSAIETSTCDNPGG